MHMHRTDSEPVRPFAHSRAALGSGRGRRAVFGDRLRWPCPTLGAGEREGAEIRAC